MDREHRRAYLLDKAYQFKIVAQNLKACKAKLERGENDEITLENQYGKTTLIFDRIGAAILLGAQTGLRHELRSVGFTEKALDRIINNAPIKQGG